MTEMWAKKPDLNEVCPTVHTGGVDRGRHYYTKSRGDVKLKTILPDFDGIDFRRHGHYVLIPGCIHPDTGRAYRWDLFCPQTAPTIPEWLFELLWVDSPANRPPRKVGEKPALDRRKPYSPPTTLSIPEIKGHLDQIPVTEYQNYDDWLKIGMAVHAACEGDPEGCDLFVDWSISDPSYYDAEESARAKWASFNEHRESGITVATLVSATILAGGSPNVLPANEVFDAPIEAAPSLLSLDEFRKSLIRSDRPSLVDAVKQALNYGPDQWDQLRDELKAVYRVRLATIDRTAIECNKAKRRIEMQRKRAAERKKKKGKAITVADPAIEVAEYLLKENFENGKHLIHAKNQQFYEYVGTHWEPIPPNEVDQLVLDAARAVQVAPENEMKFKASQLFSSCERVLMALTAKRKDVFDFQGTPKPVVNTKNAEVWINADGTHEIKDHDPESYLASCLNTEYVKDAQCPTFDRTLREIFHKNKKPDNMIRHLAEFFGYTMQPFKNIPTWWMFQGDGSNGKTFCFNVFQKLLGSAVLPRPIEEFADSGRNNHATASLVGKLLIMDDDARVDCFLPESALKKLSEAKLFEANPKRMHAFTFMSCATPVMLINDWPRIRDLSWGLIRKAYILPFKRVFAPEEYDLNRELYVVNNELPGVLNLALEGYNRLRARGQFAEPPECTEAKDEWLRAANPQIEYCKTRINKTDNGVTVAVNEVYQDYIAWCRNLGGIRYPPAKHRFELSLKQLGFNLGDHEGVLSILGACLVDDAKGAF
jgi:putative DNA primase/helicase